MFTRITSQMKDETLQWLCNNVQAEKLSGFEFKDLISHVEINIETMRAILDQFKEIGLVDKLYVEAYGRTHVVLKVKAHDLLNKGGFTVIDALNEANIQKLLYELDNLKKQLQPDQFETFNKVASIMSSIATVVAAFPGDK